MTVNELIEYLSGLPDEWKNDQVICFHDVTMDASMILNELCDANEVEIDEDEVSDEELSDKEAAENEDDESEEDMDHILDDINDEELDKIMKRPFILAPVETIARVSLTKANKEKTLFQMPVDAIFLN